MLDRVACAGAGLVALAVYLVTMPAGVGGEDGGELVAAAWSLGIPHPPGYPLWCLAVYPILHVFEVGTVAWLANFSSALFGLAGAWLVAEIVLATFGRRCAAIAAGLALAFSREYWQQAIVAEVYTLGAALVAGHFLLVARWIRSRRVRVLHAAGLAAGLAGAHYALNLVLVPVLFLLAFALDLRPLRIGRYLVLFLWSLGGAAIYAYLPIRSADDPAMDWGDPESWQRFWDVVLRAQYKHLVARDGLAADVLAGQFKTSGLQLFLEFSPWISPLALSGVAVWLGGGIARRRCGESPAFAVYTLAAFATLAAGAVLAPNYPLEYHWNWLRSAYWLPVNVTMAIAIGAQLNWLSHGSRWMYGLACAACAASPFIFNFTVNDRHGDRIAEIYAGELLEGMAPGAVYFGGGDHTVFPAVYLQIVEARRGDILLANKYGYPVPELYGLVGEAAPPRRPSEAEEQRLFERILAETERPVYSAVPRPAPGYVRVAEGLLYRYLREGEAVPQPAIVEVPPEVFDTRGEWSNELIAHEYLAARGRSLFTADRPSEALAALAQAADLVHGDKHALNNLGLNAAEGGQIEAASVYFLRALESDPLFLPAALNLAYCYLLQGTPEQCLAILERLEKVGRDNPRLEELKGAALTALEGAGAAQNF